MILSRVRITQQQRYDLEEFFAQLAAARSDAKFWTQKFLSAQNLIMGGFTVTGLGQTSAIINVANSSLIVPENTFDFSYFISAPSDSTIIIPDANIVDNARNYIEATLTAVDGTPLTKAFWDPEANAGLGAEFNQIVNTVTDLRVNFTVTTGGFSGLPDRLPIGIIDTDNAGLIKVILDRRKLFGRLSQPGNLDRNYNWGTKIDPAFSLTMSGVAGTFLADEIITIGGETATVTVGGTTTISFNEPTGINFFIGGSVTGQTSGATGTIASVFESFTGADKSLSTEKDRFDAITTEIKSIKNSRFWFQDPESDLGDISDERENRSGYLRSDDPVVWDGSSLSFTSDLILEFVNTRSGVLSKHTVPVSHSPITFNNLESAYIKVNRSLTNEVCTLFMSGTTPIPPQSKTEKQVMVLFRRQDTMTEHFLHLPFHKQLIKPGQTIRIGSSGTDGEGSGTNPLFEQEVPSGVIDGLNGSFTITQPAKTSDSIFFTVNNLKIPSADVSVIGTNVTISSPSIPKTSQNLETFYVADTSTALFASNEVPTGVVDGINDTFTAAGSIISAAAVIVFVDKVRSNVNEWSLVGSNQIVFNPGSIPQDGQDVEIFYVSSLGDTQVFQEVPTGVVDGINDTFGLSATPPYKNAAVVFVDGVRAPLSTWRLLILPSPAVKFSSGFEPKPGQSVEVYYFQITGAAVVTLQKAYDNGNTISTTIGNPFIVDGAAAKVAQFNGDIGVTGVIDPKGMTFDPQSSTPLQVSDNGIWVDSAGDLFHSRPGFPDVNVTQASAGSTYRTDKITLSSTDISNGNVTLTNSPTTPSDTILDVIGGVSQDYAVDFTVSGSTLSWLGLGLAGVLAAGDKIIVQFN